MTTIVCVTKNGRAVLAADTLISYGSSIESNEYVAGPLKITTAGDTHIAITGPSASILATRGYFRDPDVQRDFSDIDAIFETFRKFHRVLKKRYYLNPKEEEDAPFESIQMECLLANPHGIFGVFALRSVAEYKRFYALGSGGEYALGAMHALYDTLEDPAAIATAGIRAAATFDSATALPISLQSVELATGPAAGPAASSSPEP